MNKRLLIATSVIGAFLVFAFFTEGLGNHAKSQQTKTVGILQLVTHPALDQIHQGVVQGLKDGGFTEGKNLKISYQNAQANQANLKTMAQDFVNKDTDLNVGIATPAALSLAQASKNETSTLLAGITNPVGAKLVNSLKQPGKNITGVSGDSPYAKQAQVFKDILPKAKTIGIISTTSDAGGTYNAAQMTKTLKKAGYTVKNYTISSTNDMLQVATTMAGEVDAIYAPQDNSVATAMKTLVAAAKDKNVPVIPSNDTMVKDGGLITYSQSQYQVGYQAGQMAARVLKGEKAQTMPVQTVDKGTYAVNLQTAADLGIRLPDAIVKEAKENQEAY
ncbi:ABC transporter substrate-binding protein [Fructobacillus sp. M1-13]|uniref:ABC transporter substrate-binding protein n=1 Tax=Fructobacillus papyriferae TaxID=2713171 RepID=A0ABS5QPM8_9LACO|nr:tryptophan ABC transporter substrate-binding protein [Fructobacillus papyriferae]MBS9335143.1 ABC transporter substrate-binding protein [Fructobacillus papyriferae]MCD2159187.1 ABC transporter substrate-binding protein [Fructobacillus papyriferae]